MMGAFANMRKAAEEEIKRTEARRAEKAASTPKQYGPAVGERDNSVVGQMVTDNRMAYRAESRNDNSLWKQTEKDRAESSARSTERLKQLREKLKTDISVGNYDAIADTQKAIDRIEDSLYAVNPTVQKIQDDLTDKMRLQMSLGDYEGVAKTYSNPFVNKRLGDILGGSAKQSAGATGSAFAVATEGMLSGGRKTARGESMKQLEALFDKDKAIQTTQDFREKTIGLTQSGLADVEKAKMGLGGLGRLGVDTAAGMTQLGIDIGIGAATGMGAMPSLAVRAFGGAADQAKADGASIDQQIVYGLANAAVEVATERISSSNIISSKAFGKGTLDDLMNGIVAGLEDVASTEKGRAIMNRVGSILTSGMGEGLEEGIAGVLEPFLATATYGKEFEMNWDDIGYQVLIGALTGAITGISGQNTNEYRAKVAGHQAVDNSPVAVDNKITPAQPEIQQAVEKAQSADLGQPVSTKTATVLDTGTTAYVALGMKPKRAEAKAKVVQKLINGEQVSLDGMKSLNLTDAKYRAVFTQLTGVVFPEGMTNHDQLMNVAKTASEVRNNVAVAEEPIVPMAEPVIAQDIAQPVAQVSDEVGETDIMSRGISDRDSFAQVYKAVRNAQAEDAEIDSEYSKYLENAELAKDEVAVSYKGKPLTRKQFRDAFRAGNPDSTVTDAELNAVFARELERQVAQTRNDAGVGTTKTGGKGLYRDAKNEYQKVGKKTQKLLDEIGKRLGITVVIDSELKIQSGDKKGEAARGHYSHETRTLRINPELGVSAVRTFRHELTHYIQDSKPEVYEKLVDVVKNHKQYDTIRAEVEGRYEGVESDEARIMDEVMAEYAEQMCTDEQFIELLAKTDRNLFEILRDAITEFFDKLKGIDPGLDAEVEQIKKLWADALKAAEKSGGKSKVDKGHYSFSSIASTFFGNENMTAADFESGDYKKTDGYKAYVKQCLDNMSQSRLDYDEKAARKEIEDSIDGIVRVALAMKKAGYDILDSQNTRDVRDSKKRLLFSSLEPNSDYLTSSDISTICDKRKNFAAIYDDIVRAEEAKNVPKGKRFFDNVDNYFYLHKMMADKGLTQPCRQCYVESMRKNLAPMASAFLRLVNETDANNTANDQLYSQKGKNKGTLKTNNAKLRENVLNILSEYGMSASDLTVETLTTADGLATLKIQAPLVYEAFNSFYGQSKPKMPKMPKAAVPFRFGELTALLTDDHGNIKTSLIDKIESTGGFRLQSYSDFQIQNFVDVLQVIFEAGTLGLTGHAYTKVPAFLMATEGTGLKRNVSIFMYKDGSQWRIDKNDSFPGEVEDIYAIVESDTTGNTSIIAVSQNEDMSAWIMANDKVGYGIPFHKSGLKMGVVRDTVVREDGREIKGYTGTKDHTRQQTEVWAKTSEDHKALTKVSKGINIYEFWDFANTDGLSRNELIEKNIKAYIDACTDRGYLPKFREYVMNNSRVLEMTLSYAKQLGFVSQDAGIPDIAFEYKGYTIPYGYYKFLGDFGMFTPAGEAAPHAVLSLKNYNFDKAVQFFSDAETLRRNEILQQFANDGERQKYRDSGMTAEQLAEVAQQKRNEIVDEVVSGRYAVAALSDGENRVIVDRDIFNGVAEKDKPGVLSRYLLDNLRGDTIRSLDDKTEMSIASKNSELRKLARPGFAIKGNRYNARLSAATHLDEVAAASLYGYTEDNEKPDLRPNRGQVDKRFTLVEVPVWGDNGRLISSEMWLAEVTVPEDIRTGEKIAYDVKVTKDTHSVPALGKLYNRAGFDRVSFADILAQEFDIVNPNEYIVDRKHYAVGSADDFDAAVHAAFEAAYQESLKNPPAAPASQADTDMTGWVIYNQSVGAAALRFDPYTYLLNEYGAIEQTGKNYREFDIPKQTKDDNYVTKSAATIAGAEATPDKRLSDIASAVVDGKLSYIRVKNKVLENKVRNQLMKNGWKETLDTWTKAVAEGQTSDELIAMGATLLNNAGNSNMDGKAYVRLLADYAALSHRAGSALQASKILKRLSPEGKLYAIQKQLDALNTDELTQELTGQNDVVMDDDLAERYLRAKTDEDRDEIMDEILQNIADQIPASWVDKFQAWRYTAMLGNLRTPIRNTLGNVVMGTTALGKRAFAGIVEAGMQKIGKLDERTTSLLRDKETLKAAKDDYQTVKDIISGGGKYQDGKDQMNLQAEIKKRQRVFKNALLEGWRTGTQWIMDNEYFGDAAFSRATYSDALARYIAANGTTWSQASEELKDKARTVAIREAAEATFRDNNQFSQWVSGFGKVRHQGNKVDKAFHTVVEGVLPFKKTPANILVRATEYSPLGLMNAVIQSVVKPVGAAIQDTNAPKKLKQVMNKEHLTVNEIVDNYCKGLTGSAILGMGWLLADLGFLQGASPDDEKEKELWEMQGHQEYAIEFSVGGKQYSYTIDWVSPVSIPLLVGAELYEAMQSKGLTKREMIDVSMAIFDPMLEMSMLQGLNDALSNAQTWGDEAALTKFVGNAIWGYMTQFTPTLLGQAERASVNTRMTTYADKNKDIPDGVQRLIGRASAKIPGIDVAQTYYMDAWGRTQSNASSATMNYIEQFLSPGYANAIVESDMEKELLRLKQATGESGVLIASAPKYFNVDNVRKDLTAAEYLTYAKTRGQTAYSLLTEMTAGTTYNGMPDGEKVYAVERAYDYSNQIAKELVTNGKYAVEKWVGEARTLEAEYGVDVTTYLTAYASTKDMTSLKDKGETVDNSLALKKANYILSIPGLTDEQRVALADTLGCNQTVLGWLKRNPKLIPNKLAAMEKKYG